VEDLVEGDVLVGGVGIAHVAWAVLEGGDACGGVLPQV
jgi:hypothetical protein